MAAINLTPGHKYILCTENKLHSRVCSPWWGPLGWGRPGGPPGGGRRGSAKARHWAGLQVSRPLGPFRSDGVVPVTLSKEANDHVAASAFYLVTAESPQPRRLCRTTRNCSRLCPTPRKSRAVWVPELVRARRGHCPHCLKPVGETNACKNVTTFLTVMSRRTGEGR